MLALNSLGSLEQPGTPDLAVLSVLVLGPRLGWGWLLIGQK